MNRLLLLVTVVAATVVLSHALECGDCGDSSKVCKSGKWAECVGCSCSCTSDLDCRPGVETCSTMDTPIPCFADFCPRSCTLVADTDMAGDAGGAAGTTADDADSDDSSTSSQDNGGGGGNCVKSCDTASLCTFKCIKYPLARCVVDKCKCEATFQDEDGNEPNCFGLANDENAPDDDWFPAAPDTGDDNSDIKSDVDDDDVIVPTLQTSSSSSSDKNTAVVEVAVNNDVTEKGKAGDDDVTGVEAEEPENSRKHSVFHQVIIPTFLVVVVIVVAFLIWKGYGKWMRRKAKNKQLRDDKKAAAADLEESTKPLNRPADANV